MINFKKLEGLNDSYNPESVILQRYPYLTNGDISSVSDCILNSFDVFQKVCDLGKNIFETYLKLNNCTKNDIYKMGLIKEDISDLPPVSTYNDLINNWINDNGLPYSIKVRLNDQKAFIVDDSLTCYFYSQLHKRLILWDEEDKNSTNPDRKPNPKYNIELYVSLLRMDISNEIRSFFNGRGSLYNKGVIDILYNGDTSEDEIYNKLNKFLNSKNNYSELIDDNMIFFIRAALISYIVRGINDTYSITCQEYTLSKQIPVYNSDTKEFRFYETATSLMGIAWNRLLQIISTSKYGYTRVPCRNEECNNYFIKNGKNQFCETCINNGTARKIIYREYNKKRKK